jgi:hypothetical protein
MAIEQLSMAHGADDLSDVASIIARPAWMARAACKGEPIATFFPPNGGDKARTTARAAELCGSCGVVDECAAFAASDPDVHGWWGGRRVRPGWRGCG